MKIKCECGEFSEIYSPDRIDIVFQGCGIWANKHREICKKDIILIWKGE